VCVLCFVFLAFGSGVRGFVGLACRWPPLRSSFEPNFELRIVRWKDWYEREILTFEQKVPRRQIKCGEFTQPFL
jgi:hypothetical protein